MRIQATTLPPDYRHDPTLRYFNNWTKAVLGSRYNNPTEDPRKLRKRLLRYATKVKSFQKVFTNRITETDGN